MDFITRNQWGARPATTSTNITPVGVAVHWEGPYMGSFSHAECASRVRSIQAFHMDTRGWADGAYSAIVCPHGSVFEMRGPGHRTAANGTNDGNQRYYAVCFLGGTNNVFTDGAKDGINDAIEWLGGGEVVGHRDLTETECPGEQIYAWVNNGHPRSTAPTPAPAPEPDVTPPSCEEQVFQLGDSHWPCVVQIQNLLNARGFGLSNDGEFGPKTDAAVRKFQANHRLTADGVVGPKTWASLWWGYR